MGRHLELALTGTGLCVCYHLRRTARAVTRLYDIALQPTGLRSTQFAVLVAIAKSEPINISTLEDLLGLDQTTLSRSLANLKNAGHVTLVAGADRRERLTALTEQGRRTLGRAMPYWRKVQRDVVSRLVGPDWHSIEKSLRAVKNVSGRLLASTLEARVEPGGEEGPRVRPATAARGPARRARGGASGGRSVPAG